MDVSTLPPAAEAKLPADPRPVGPAPFALWKFNSPPPAGELKGGARIAGGRLVLPKESDSHFESEPITGDIREKTLEAWVALDDLTRDGGAAISIVKEAGGDFDAIVFGDGQSKKWVSGSAGFRRTKGLLALEETAAPGTLIHVAIVYGADNSIAFFRNGLGTENENLPAFVVLPDPRGLPAGGSINWTSGFLPANHQGVSFRTNSDEPIADLRTPDGISPATRHADMALLASMNRDFASANPGDTTFAARLRSYELAARMQSSIPDATGIDAEPESVKKLYGIDESANKGFARNCLMARRLLERGVRFVQILNGGSFGKPRTNWDGHEDVKENHDTQAATMDKPVAALIQDLKQRGMLEDTLFIWSTEFGRSPATQGVGSMGRDHHPTAFTCFLAGAGVKAGTTFGSSDEIGYFVGEDKVIIPDFHATILHLLGIDHEKLTFYHNGVNRRLTDVHGQVIMPILA